MKLSVQTDELSRLKEALASNCDELRFGPEFCEWKIPNLPALKKAYALTIKNEKAFSYVTPKVSNDGIKRIREQIDYLSDKGNIDVVINDFGVLNIIGDYPELTPHLGRQLIYVPGRSPWLKSRTKDIIRYFPSSIISKIRMRHVDDLYSQTNLNYAPTAEFFQRYNIKDVDVEWIPKCFRYYGLLVKKGFNLCVHMDLVLVTVTRRCHTARFLNERNPETCSRPCNARAFLLRTPVESELFLSGNAVFSFVEYSERDLRKLLNSNIAEFVITANPITKGLGRWKIDDLVSRMHKLAK